MIWSRLPVCLTTGGLGFVPWAWKAWSMKKKAFFPPRVQDFWCIHYIKHEPAIEKVHIMHNGSIRWLVSCALVWCKHLAFWCYCVQGYPSTFHQLHVFFLGNPMMGPDTKNINTPAQGLLMLNMGKYFKMPCMMWPGVTLGLHSEIIIIEQLYILLPTTIT